MGGSIGSVEDPAVTYSLPTVYRGVIQGATRCTLAEPFLDLSFEPVASSRPSRDALLSWWLAVARIVRASYAKQKIPDLLKAALKDRERRYRHLEGPGRVSAATASQSPAGAVVGAGARRTARLPRAQSQPATASSSSALSGGSSASAVADSPLGGTTPPEVTGLTADEVRVLKALAGLLKPLLNLE